MGAEGLQSMGLCGGWVSMDEISCRVGSETRFWVLEFGRRAIWRWGKFGIWMKWTRTVRGVLGSMSD